jgi:hypothetical protein
MSIYVYRLQLINIHHHTLILTLPFASNDSKKYKISHRSLVSTDDGRLPPSLFCIQLLAQLLGRFATKRAGSYFSLLLINDVA